METIALNALPPLPTGERRYTVSGSSDESRGRSRGVACIYPRTPRRDPKYVRSNTAVTIEQPALKRHLSALLSPSLTRRTLGTRSDNSLLPAASEGDLRADLPRLPNAQVLRVRDESPASTRGSSSGSGTTRSRRRDSSPLTGTHQLAACRDSSPGVCHKVSGSRTLSGSTRGSADSASLLPRRQRDQSLTRWRSPRASPSTSPASRGRSKQVTDQPSSVPQPKPTNEQVQKESESENTLSPEMIARCRAWVLSVQRSNGEHAIDVTPPVVWND